MIQLRRKLAIRCFFSEFSPFACESFLIPNNFETTHLFILVAMYRCRY